MTSRSATAGVEAASPPGCISRSALKVVAGKVRRPGAWPTHSTARSGQSADGKADFYENVGNDWHTGGDRALLRHLLGGGTLGSFWFFKTGDPETPTGDCLLRDGPGRLEKAEIFATGFSSCDRPGYVADQRRQRRPTQENPTGCR